MIFFLIMKMGGMRNSLNNTFDSMVKIIIFDNRFDSIPRSKLLYLTTDSILFHGQNYYI